MFGKPVIIDGRYVGWAFTKEGAAKKASQALRQRGTFRSGGELRPSLYDKDGAFEMESNCYPPRLDVNGKKIPR